MGVTQGGSEVGGQGLTRGVLGSSMWVTASPAAPQQKALWGTSSSHPIPHPCSLFTSLHCFCSISSR